jgi:urocanate reductase
MNQGMDRRDFLKGAVACAGAVVLTGMNADNAKAVSLEEASGKWAFETDVLVVGGGGTGMVAAITAREAGAEVAVIEKSPAIGGTTAISGALIQAAGTRFQIAAGIKGDTTDRHYQYWLESSENVADPQLVRLMAEEAPANIEWLTSHGVDFVSVYGSDPIPYIDPVLMEPRIHVPKGQGDAAKWGTGRIYIMTLNAEARKRDVRFILETAGLALIKDKAGAVAGVKAKGENGEIYCKARKAVILASGDFARNRQMAKAFSPRQSWALETGECWASPFSTGDGIKMAMGAGADLAGLGGTIGIPNHGIGIAPLSKGVPVVPGIWVNKYGQRFVNEGASFGYVMRALFFQEQQIAWALFDEKVKKMGGQIIAGVAKPWTDDIQKEIDEGRVKKADNLKALAETIEVNISSLEHTVAQWNRDTANGKDSLFGKAVGLEPLKHPPYYATLVTEINLGTCGGVKINTKAQVVDVWGNVIPRLYAGGMTAGGFIGPYYPGSGTAIAATVCFGRIAGKYAAEEAPYKS